jgi:hypothetical protein
MKFNISFELDMDDEQMHAWARAYGLTMDQVASDASHKLGELVRTRIAAIAHVEDYTTMTHYQVH